MGWVRWRHRQVLLRSHGCGPDGLWGIGCFGCGREQSTTKVHLGSHPHPHVLRLGEDPELPPRCRPSHVLSSATQRKMPSGSAPWIPLCWLLARPGPTTAPPRGAGISTASSRAPTIGPHPSGCFCFKAAIRLDGRSYPRQVSLWISLLMSDFSGKDDRVSGLRDTVWLSTFSSRNRVVLIPGWLMRSGSGQASRPFFLRNGAAATQPAVLTPRSCFLRHTYPISYPHPNKAH